jgi:hypothetical protein
VKYADTNMHLEEAILPYKWLLFPKIGYAVLCIHHALVDGVSLFSALQAMTNEADMSQLPSVAISSWQQRLR